MWRELQSRVGAAWCKLMHDSPMWPLYGRYTCRTCGRRYPAFAEAPIAKRPDRSAPPTPLQSPVGAFHGSVAGSHLN